MYSSRRDFAALLVALGDLSFNPHEVFNASIFGGSGKGG